MPGVKILKDASFGELPLGLGMALAQNPAAMKSFCRMDNGARQKLIEEAHRAQSKTEMQTLVNHLTRQG
jgi:uncharacterized protein YdeI (YjbR/CyaY-like superfamily)